MKTKRIRLYAILLACTFIISLRPTLGQESPHGKDVFDINLHQDYYFPANIRFSNNIPSPRQFFGRDIGKFHTRYDQILQYFKELENKSERVCLDTIGYTWEQRPLVVLKISATKNIQTLDQIHQQHIQTIEYAKRGQINEDSKNPTFVFLGFSVHGNESSPAEAALLTAYYLSAAQGSEIDDYLDNGVYFIDPVRNPDGYERYVTWINANSVYPPIGNPLDREHNEAWPGGRTNHYWFDLNRDWINQVHPESKARVTYFQKWLPQVQGDFHEMNAASTFFFEPTKPEAQESPWVPKSTYELNNVFAKYYATALDNIGSLYYTKEQFDNINPTYGSSYPDHVGSLGVLFEQASPRGLLQHTTSGDLTYPFAIRNHLRIALSTIQASVENREQLQKNQLQFFRSALDLASKDAIKGYLVDAKYNRRAIENFVELLKRHQISFQISREDIQIGEQVFEKEQSLWIPTAQANYRLIKVIFDEEKNYIDSVFYDGSGNSLAYLYGFSYAGLTHKIASSSTDDISNIWKTNNDWSQTAFGFLVDWQQDAAPWLLAQLLQNNILVKTATNPFKVSIEGNPTPFGYGSLFIPNTGQNRTTESLRTLLQQLGAKGGIQINPVHTGFSIQGNDLGSNSFKIIKPQNALLVTGQGIRAYEAGEVWYSFERQLEYPLVRVDIDKFSRVNLDQFQVLILVNGDFSSLNQKQMDKIHAWKRAGGTLIVFGNTGKWLTEKKLTSFQFLNDKELSEKQTQEKQRFPYASATNRQGAERIGGTFFKTEIDITHPIGYGYINPQKAVFRNHSLFVEQGTHPYHNVAIYSQNPLLNGYVSQANQERLENTSSILLETEGAGRTVYFIENPVFRGISYSNSRAFYNAVFLGQILK